MMVGGAIGRLKWHPPPPIPPPPKKPTTTTSAHTHTQKTNTNHTHTRRRSQVVSGIRYDLVIAVKRSTRPNAAPEYYRIDLVSQPWVQPPYRLLGARPLTLQEAEAAEAAAPKGKGKGGSKRGLLAAAGEAIRRAAARLR